MVVVFQVKLKKSVWGWVLDVDEVGKIAACSHLFRWSWRRQRWWSWGWVGLPKKVLDRAAKAESDKGQSTQPSICHCCPGWEEHRHRQWRWWPAQFRSVETVTMSSCLFLGDGDLCRGISLSQALCCRWCRGLCRCYLSIFLSNGSSSSLVIRLLIDEVNHICDDIAHLSIVDDMMMLLLVMGDLRIGKVSG